MREFFESHKHLILNFTLWLTSESGLFQKTFLSSVKAAQNPRILILESQA